MTDKIKLPLFVTRLLIFIFLLPWVVMRFTTPDSSKGIAAKYYKISEMSDILNTAIGVFWVLLLIAFLFGFKKKISYLLVLLLHTVGTLFTLPYLIPGSENFKIMFYAAMPTIGAMWLLFALRDHDTIMTIDKS